MRHINVIIIISMIFLMLGACTPEETDTDGTNGVPEPVATEDNDTARVVTPPEQVDLSDEVDTPIENTDIPGQTADGASDGSTSYGEPLFDFRTRPDDWPEDVPILNRFRFYEYENTETMMHAFAIGNVPIDHVTSFYINMLTDTSGQFGWVPDPNNESVEEGNERILYFVKEGKAIGVHITTMGEMETSLDLTVTHYD